MVAEPKQPDPDRNAKNGQFVKGHTVRGQKRPRFEKAAVLWRAALKRAERYGYKTIDDWLASAQVDDKDFFALFKQAIPRDVKVESEVQLSYEDWLTDLRARAAEEKAERLAKEAQTPTR